MTLQDIENICHVNGQIDELISLLDRDTLDWFAEARHQQSDLELVASYLVDYQDHLNNFLPADKVIRIFENFKLVADNYFMPTRPETFELADQYDLTLWAVDINTGASTACDSDEDRQEAIDQNKVVGFELYMLCEKEVEVDEFKITEKLI